MGEVERVLSASLFKSTKTLWFSPHGLTNLIVNFAVIRTLNFCVQCNRLIDNSLNDRMYVFDRKLSSLSQTEIPDLSTSVNESLQDVTTELDTRATESDSPKHHQCMVSYVYGITK